MATRAPKRSRRVFAEHPDVDAATAYTAGSFLISRRAVPGVAATTVKGELLPTLLRGVAPRTDGEIVVGQDTLGDIGASIGDVVPVQLSSAPAAGEQPATGRAGEPRGMRIVGVATFPAVDQMGTDMPHLGIGALMTRAAYVRLHGDDANLPEFTTVRLHAGADAGGLVTRRSEFHDAARSTTNWFTNAKPAELRQLDEALPALRWGLALGFASLGAVMVHALWTRGRSQRRDLAVLRALGATRGQLDAVAAWQAVPFAIGAVVIGIPIGVVLGRRSFTAFARSMAVVDTASTSFTALSVLVLAVLAATGAGCVAGIVVARRRTGGQVPPEG